MGHRSVRRVLVPSASADVLADHASKRRISLQADRRRVAGSGRVSGAASELEGLLAATDVFAGKHRPCKHQKAAGGSAGQGWRDRSVLQDVRRGVSHLSVPP